MPIHLDVETLSLAATCLLCGYFTNLSTTPPNLEPTALQPNDTFAYIVMQNPLLLLLQKTIAASFWLYHISLILVFPGPASSTPLCPRTENLNPALFTWSLSTLTFTALVIVGALLRLLAYKQLGANFTFTLAKPKQLVTNGMYGYVQHPSYTALFIVVLGNALMLLRTDGVLGCWLPRWIADSELLNRYGHLVFLVQAVIGVVFRANEEEAMLRRTMGKTWEDYHAKTKKFVPWLI